MKTKISFLCSLIIGGAVAFSTFTGFAQPPQDVKADHWAAKAVEGLVEKGIVKLDPDQKFNGKKAMSRYDMAVVLSRTLEQIDENGMRQISQTELAEIKRLYKMVTEEIIAMRQDTELIEKNHEKIIVQNQQIDDKIADIAERIGKIESSKSPVQISGDWRLRYQHTALDAKNNKGTLSDNNNQFRLSFRVSYDPKLSLTGRLKFTEPIGRRGERSTQTNLDLFYFDKRSLQKRMDLRIGRQFHRHGNAMVFMDFFDGLLINKFVDHHWRWSGGVVALHTANNVVANRSHGINANFMSLEFKPNDEDFYLLSRFENNATTDKIGVWGDPFPRTKEGWASFDFRQKPHNKLEYYGTVAMYTNQLDGSNTKPAERHLRGDTENMGYMLGANYFMTKKLKLGAVWALHEDNFHAFSVLSDQYWLMTPPAHPLEDSLTALGIVSNLPGKTVSEGIYPASQADAKPYASPIARPGDVRSAWPNIQDIHGYKNFQMTGQYYFNRRLSLRLSGAWMTPAKSRYNYRDVSSYMARLNFQYDSRINLELRGMQVTSDYDRSINDFRTELFCRF